jgi:Bacteriocin-protection, YdeI or OmpD-Associated
MTIKSRDDKLTSEALSKKEISGGVVHDLPADLKRALVSDAKALETWEDITSLARNEWICWIESAKKAETRTPGSNGAVPASKRESGDPVVGLVVRIVEIIWPLSRFIQSSK